jgi:RNA polymerase sigma-70 factor (ECF subfamily)
MTAEDEDGLVQRSLEGDREAFGKLVCAYQHVLFNIALRMVGDREDARDITQSAFLKAWRKLDTFDRQHRFFSWMCRIVINEALNDIHRRRRLEPLHDTMVAPDRRPDEDAEADELEGFVQEGLMKLSPEHRQVVILRHFLHLSHREIGEALHLPEKTVKSRLHDGRQHLGRFLRRRGVGAE